MHNPSADQPDRLLDDIPPPDTVRAWLAASIRRSTLLRSLLRTAERKARYERGHGDGRGHSHAIEASP